jgi:hypothetical protein
MNKHGREKMGILKALAQSRRLSETRPVVVLMYPRRLKHLVKPGSKLMLYHGSLNTNLQSLTPLSDYAVRHQFAKHRRGRLQPFVFLASNPYFAASYAVPEEVQTALRSLQREQGQLQPTTALSEIMKSFGCVYLYELQIPHKFASKPYILERIVCNELEEVVVASNRSITPTHRYNSFQHLLRGVTLMERMEKVINLLKTYRGGPDSPTWWKK